MKHDNMNKFNLIYWLCQLKGGIQSHELFKIVSVTDPSNMTLINSESISTRYALACLPNQIMKLEKSDTPPKV
jgi:hypothetical protein